MNYKILLGLLSSCAAGTGAFSAQDPGGMGASGQVYYDFYDGTTHFAFTGNPEKGLTVLRGSIPSFTPLPALDDDYISIRGISVDGSTLFGTSAEQAVIWRNGALTKIAPIVSAADDESGIYSHAQFASDDGSVVAGTTSYQVDGNYRSSAFVWKAGGSVLLPGLAQGIYTNLETMTPDGSVIAGSVSGSGFDHAVFWRNQAITDIHPADLPGGISKSIKISDNGSVIALNAAPSGTYDYRAYRWTQSGGSVALGHLGSGANSSVSGMSSTGSVIIGDATVDAHNSVRHAFRWTTSGGMRDIHPDSLITTASASDSSQAKFINRDGSLVFGQASLASGSVMSFRWAESGVINLGGLGGNKTYINAITPDGKVAVGTSEDAGEFERGFRWTENGGMQTIEQWLAESGVELSGDFQVASAEDISDDGSVVFGYLEDHEPFAARGTGIVTIADLQRSISQTAAAISSLRSSAGLVLNGAHGHPLARRAESGRFIAWAGGDYGADDHGERDGDLSVAEAGGGYNFGPAQLNLALGKSGSVQDTELGGEVDHDGLFLIGDLIVPVPSTPLVVTLTGIYQRGDLDTRRGYLNAGVPDSSSGESDTEVYGGALRLDWVDAFTVGDVAFTPFTKFVITRSKVDGFTETGGGFPAVYKTQRDTISDLHLGVNAAYELRAHVRLIATLEGVYRFQDGASSSSVSVPGVTAGFTSLAGEDYKQFWVSGGAGVEYDIGNGTVSVTLNGSSDSPTSNLWLATSYQYKF